MTGQRILSNWWPAFGGLAKFNPKDSLCMEEKKGIARDELQLQ